MNIFELLVDFPGAHGDIDHLVDVSFLSRMRFEDDIRRHDLGQRSRLDAHVRILRGDDLAAGGVEQQPGAGGDRAGPARFVRWRRTSAGHWRRGP
jgi:hypothetical protein